ncbi:MAG: universal stress protein [Leptolyngbyaceae cyanobacterium RU_5_1]|nr:universal stress protein [Leptolyngbyaceae cyanobacterium RU_5_1]
MFKKILAAIAPLNTSDQVIREATTLAKLTSAELMLLHVLSPVDEGYPTPIYPGPDSVYPGPHDEVIRAYAQQWEAYERRGLELLKSLTEQVSATGIPVEFTQNVGDPGRAICHLADTWSADLIILGRRGHSGLKELVLGSVSNYVLHHAPCSVLTIQGHLPES